MLDPDLEHLFPGQPALRMSARHEWAVRAGVVDGSLRGNLGVHLARYLAERAVLGYRCFVIGLSGGVDSAVCAQLARDAAPGAVHTVVIDLGDAPDETHIGIQLAEAMALPCTVLEAGDAYAAQCRVMPDGPLIGRIHLRSRLITSLLYQFADGCRGLVIDTTDRSEEILRLYEEGRRGHVAPVIELYKSELYAMAAAMGLGKLSASGCPDLNNLDAFGLDWRHLDAMIDALATGTSTDALATATGLDLAWLERLAQRIRVQPLRTDLVRLGVGGPMRETSPLACPSLDRPEPPG